MGNDVRRRTVTADEADYYSYRWRKWISWQRGESKKIKRGTHHRERREGKAEIRAQLADS